MKRRAFLSFAAIPALERARRLDLAADAHLQLGFHAQAERLSRQAAELRGQT